MSLGVPSELHPFVDAIQDLAILRLDPEGRVVTWNEGARRLKGYEASEIRGRHISVFYTPEDQADRKAEALLAQASRAGRVVDEGWRVRKDGTLFWAEAVVTAIRDDSGTLAGYAKVTRDLTEEHEALEALRHSEEQLALLVGSIKDYAIFVLDEKGVVRSWSAVAEAIKGYASSEVIGNHFSVFYTPEDIARGRPSELLRIAAADGRVEDEGWRVRKDGSRFWADVVISAMRNHAGELVGYAKVTRDLTTRRRAEEALRQSEERFRLMIDSVGDYAIFLLDPEGRVTSWNASAERLQGYSAAEVVGKPFALFYTPEDRLAGKPDFERANAARDGRYEDEGWRVRKNGSLFWANVILSAVRDESGTLIGFTKVTRDMSERKGAQELQARRARQQAGVAELGIAVLRSTDVGAALDDVASAAARLLEADAAGVLDLVESRGLSLRAGFGWRPGIVGSAVLPIGPGSLGELLVETGAPVFLSDLRADPRFVAPAVLGDHRLMSGLSAPVHSVEGEVYGALFVASKALRRFTLDEANTLQALANVVAAALARRDADENVRRAELQARQEHLSLTRAREAVQERDEFLSVAAHELRTPLAALVLKLETLERTFPAAADAADLERLRKRLQTSVRHTARLTQLVDRLLDVSRIVAGRIELLPEEQDVGAIVRAVADEFREQARQLGSTIAVSASGSGRVTCDRVRVAQVVANLVGNALKYGGGRPVEIDIDGRGAADVSLRVRDQGIGISAEDLERIFGRFERAVPVSHYGGLGLGLYISRHLVEAHGGSLAVESAAGSGSTFTVRLPRILDEVVAHRELQESAGA